MGTSFHASGAEFEAAQRDFDFLIPFQTRKLLSTADVAHILRREDDFVRKLVERGKLEAHLDSAYGNRLSARITRRSVCVHLARTANYLAADFYRPLIEAAQSLPTNLRVELILTLISGCDTAALTRIITRISAIKSTR